MVASALSSLEAQILVLDKHSESDFVKLIKEMRYAVQVTKRKEELTRLLAEPIRYDLAFVSNQLAGFVAMLRESRPDTPIIVYTNHVNREELSSLLAQGISDILLPPFFADSIRLKVMQFSSAIEGAAWTRSTMPPVLEHFGLAHTWTMGETGLCFRKLPNQLGSIQHPRDRTTVCLYFNAEGKHGEPVVIGNSAHPVSFGNWKPKASGLKYLCNKHSGQNDETFGQFLVEFRNFVGSNADECLLLDHRPSRVSPIGSVELPKWLKDLGLKGFVWKNIAVVYFKQDSASAMPFERGLLDSFRVLYRQLLLSHVAAEVHYKMLRPSKVKVSLRDSLIWCSVAWKEISTDCLKKSWVDAKLLPEHAQLSRAEQEKQDLLIHGACKDNPTLTAPAEGKAHKMSSKIESFELGDKQLPTEMQEPVNQIANLFKQLGYEGEVISNFLFDPTESRTEAPPTSMKGPQFTSTPYRQQEKLSVAFPQDADYDSDKEVGTVGLQSYQEALRSASELAAFVANNNSIIDVESAALAAKLLAQLGKSAAKDKIKKGVPTEKRTKTLSQRIRTVSEMFTGKEKASSAISPTTSPPLSPRPELFSLPELLSLHEEQASHTEEASDANVAIQMRSDEEMSDKEMSCKEGSDEEMSGEEVSDGGMSGGQTMSGKEMMQHMQEERKQAEFHDERHGFKFETDKSRLTLSLNGIEYTSQLPVQKINEIPVVYKGKEKPVMRKGNEKLVVRKGEEKPVVRKGKEKRKAKENPVAQQDEEMIMMRKGKEHTIKQKGEEMSVAQNGQVITALQRAFLDDGEQGGSSMRVNNGNSLSSHTFTFNGADALDPQVIDLLLPSSYHIESELSESDSTA